METSSPQDVPARRDAPPGRQPVGRLPAGQHVAIGSDAQPAPGEAGTGDDEVDAAVATLTLPAGATLAEQVEVLESVHRRLQARLTDLEA